MKTIPSILTLAVVLMAGGCASTPRAVEKPRPAYNALPMKYQTLFTAWLSQDCHVDSGEIQADMVSAGPILEESLWEAFDLGPTEDVRDELQHSLGERYRLRLRWLVQNGADAVGTSFRTQLLSESEEQFRATETEKLNNRWRDAALAGLGLVCTHRSLDRLRLIAKDNQNPSAIAAGVALEASGNCQPR